MGKTGTPRSTSERRGRSHLLSSWLMLKRPTGTRMLPARNFNQSLMISSTHACSSEISELLLPSIDPEKPWKPPSETLFLSTSSSVKRSNSTSNRPRSRSPIVASPVSTKRRNVNVSPTLGRSEASNRVEPYPPILKSLSQEGRRDARPDGGGAGWTTGAAGAAGAGAGAATGAGAGAGGGAAFLVSSSCRFSSPTWSSRALSFSSISSGVAARAVRARTGTPPRAATTISNQATNRNRARMATSSSISAACNGPPRQVASLPEATSLLGGWLVDGSLDPCARLGRTRQHTGSRGDGRCRIADDLPVSDA